MDYKKMLFFARRFSLQERQPVCLKGSQGGWLKRVLLLSIMCGFAIVRALQTVPQEGWFAIYPSIYVPCLPTEISEEAPAPVLQFRIAEWFKRI